MNVFKNIVSKKNCIYIFTLLLFSTFILSCGKTDTDIQWEKDILGYWEPVNSSGGRIDFLPCLKFDNESRGVMYYNADFAHPYEFSWEIRQKQLRLYYDEIPPYPVGSNKYNSESLFKIKSFENDLISVIQLTNDGVQTEYDIKRTVFNAISQD